MKRTEFWDFCPVYVGDILSEVLILKRLNTVINFTKKRRNGVNLLYRHVPKASDMNPQS